MNMTKLKISCILIFVCIQATIVYSRQTKITSTKRSPADLNTDAQAETPSRGKRQSCSCDACAQRLNPLPTGRRIPYGAVRKVLNFLKIARRQMKISYTKQGRLYCKNGYIIYIGPDGTVGGTNRYQDIYSVLEFQSLGAGMIVIKGVATGRYLAINNQGTLYSSNTYTKEVVMEERQEENFYHSFNSYRYRKHGWYVALRRNGQVKKTSVLQKATQFLVLYT